MSKEISEEINILPNHHYALHIPSQMEWFGPLLSVAEFGGESLVGVLQKMHTNGRMGKFFSCAEMDRRFSLT